MVVDIHRLPVSTRRAERPASSVMATKVLSKAATKGVIHRNTVSRKISRLARRLNQVKAQAAPAS